MRLMYEEEERKIIEESSRRERERYGDKRKVLNGEGSWDAESI